MRGPPCNAEATRKPRRCSAFWRRSANRIEAKQRADTQLVFETMLEEDRRQREAEHRFQTERLNRLPEELAKEPDRIRAIYQVQATRVEPVGLVYLWPVGA